MSIIAIDDGRDADTALALEGLYRRYEAAKARRGEWESLWRDAYEYALPQRQGFGAAVRSGENRMERLYDGTALDAVEQLAASLLGNLMPPWTQWFGLKPGPDTPPDRAEALAPVLEKAARTIQAHFDRSNFVVEIHQCFLDLIVGGTACLFLEENEPGEFSAFNFTAVPLSRIVLEEGAGGLLNAAFREISLTLAQLRDRYAGAEIPDAVLKEGMKDPQKRFTVLECIVPERYRYSFTALLPQAGSGPQLLKKTTVAESPMIGFRWLKSPGESYGRSPVMKALPDIKTANKVVELILKNASIAVTGIWQADDDGVLNPANVELKPGSIIPKAVGSQGLRPLEMPGRFDISQLVLEDLRSRIRHALLADKLTPVTSRRMTATEVLERSAEMAMLLGATYGRLQTELMTPLVQRAYAILRRRGEVPDINIDGRYVALDYRSPLARAQGQRNVQNTLFWLESVQAMGPAALAAVNLPQAARVLGDALGVPGDLILNELPMMKEITNVSVPENNPRSGAALE
ncbi:MAG: head-tail connector protein [Micavibrio aeruginosavorus]|nr:head-tail connector protein [Micavibrio aeruginosavorus]